jgi:hypothetical protein
VNDQGIDGERGGGWRVATESEGMAETGKAEDLPISKASFC